MQPSPNSPQYSPGEAARSGFIGKRPVIYTEDGIPVAVDQPLLSLWRCAQGQSLDQVLANCQSEHLPPELLCASLACLVEAGLLNRNMPFAANEALESPRDHFSEMDKSDQVSVVIVSYNSRDWLEACLASLRSQTYLPHEIIVVDNASSDGTIEWLASQQSPIRSFSLPAGHGLAYAINRGIEATSGNYLLLLNPDVSLAEEAIAEMLSVARRFPDYAAVAAKLKFMGAPAFLNGLGNRVGAFSWGTDNAMGHLDLGQFDNWQEVPSACFAAALIPRPAWEKVGGLDENFFLYYEDVEWCYRSRLLGYTIRAAPRAIVYHALGRRIHTGKDVDLTPEKLSRVVYGRLRFAAKIIHSQSERLHFLFNYSIEDGLRSLLHLSRWDWPRLRAINQGWRKYLSELSALRTERRRLQDRRATLSAGLFDMQRQYPPSFMWQGLPELSIEIVRTHYLPIMLSGATRSMPELSSFDPKPGLLIISHDVIDIKMAGTGMRYLEMARALSTELTVTLAIPSDTTLEIPNVRLVSFRWDEPEPIQRLADESDVILISSFILNKFPFLSKSAARLVVDLYDPQVLENLHYYQAEPRGVQDDLNQQAIKLMNQLAQIGDYFICANERQRDFWMGILAANGRVNPAFFNQDASLNNLLGIVGMGMPERPPRHKPILRGIHPAFSATTPIVLWGGGLWDWLDPLSLIHAWSDVLAQYPEARLVFLGTRHPNPLVPQHKMAARAEALASELGHKDSTIFFIEWLAYEEREALLCEADVGVSLHPLHIETRYSIRTRILDYIWASLPMVVSGGDVTSEWVQEHHLGRVVTPLAIDELAAALIAVLSVPKESWAENFNNLRQDLTWSRMVAPLRDYCLHGQPAPDRARLRGQIKSALPLRGRISRARYIWRTQGTRMLLHRLWRYLQWRLS
jgi:GT2 family glycosyltransferase